MEKKRNEPNNKKGDLLKEFVITMARVNELTPLITATNPKIFNEVEGLTRRIQEIHSLLDKM